MGGALGAACMRKATFLPVYPDGRMVGLTPAQFAPLCWRKSGSFFAGVAFWCAVDGAVSRQKSRLVGPGAGVRALGSLGDLTAALLLPNPVFPCHVDGFFCPFCETIPLVSHLVIARYWFGTAAAWAPVWERFGGGGGQACVRCWAFIVQDGGSGALLCAGQIRGR